MDLLCMVSSLGQCIFVHRDSVQCLYMPGRISRICLAVQHGVLKE